MDPQIYDGNVRPEEWLKQIKTYCFLNKIDEDRDIEFAKMMVDSTIDVPENVTSWNELVESLKNDVSFTIFKNANKRKLFELRYKNETEGGDTARFIDAFRKLCRDAEITDVEELKKYFVQTLPYSLKNKFLSETSNEGGITSLNDIILRFNNILFEPTNFGFKNIKNGSIVALKHIATGKYLSTIENLNYKTGSYAQMVFVSSSDFERFALWKIKFDNKDFATSDTFISLQQQFNKFLGVKYGSRDYHFKSPSDNSEVACSLTEQRTDTNWRFTHVNLAHQGYLKSNDIITLSIKSRETSQYQFLRSHDSKVTIDDETFQEVFCHNKRIGANDEWCIELIQEPSESPKSSASTVQESSEPSS